MHCADCRHRRRHTLWKSYFLMRRHDAAADAAPMWRVCKLKLTGPGVNLLRAFRSKKSPRSTSIAWVSCSSLVEPISPVATEGASSGAGVAVAPGGASAGGLAGGVAG